ncbi:YopX family protein [Prevotella koreensis]
MEYNTYVIFENGAFWTIGENTNDHDTLLCYYINPISPLVEVNVIGNIHNNPELLKGDKNEKDNV